MGDLNLTYPLPLGKVGSITVIRELSGKQSAEFARTSLGDNSKPKFAKLRKGQACVRDILSPGLVYEYSDPGEKRIVHTSTAGEQYVYFQEKIDNPAALFRSWLRLITP